MKNKFNPLPWNPSIPVYNADGLDQIQETVFPYIEQALVSGMEILIYMDNYRTEDWYGYKGWLRRLKDPVKARMASQNTHKRVLDRLKEGDVVYDCGANEGFMSVLYAKKIGPSGRVLSFEPDPKNCALIRKNAELNGLQNIHIVQKALSDRPGTVTFASEVIQPSGAPGFCVETDILDHYTSLPVTFIKIDVEGYELPVLRGAKKILAAGPTIELEMHLSKTTGIHMKKRFGFDPDDIYRLLWGYGYTLQWPDGKDIKLGDEPGGCIYCSTSKEAARGKL